MLCQVVESIVSACLTFELEKKNILSKWQFISLRALNSRWHPPARHQHCFLSQTTPVSHLPRTIQSFWYNFALFHSFKPLQLELSWATPTVHRELPLKSSLLCQNWILHFCKPYKLENGVPQDSVLSPTLLSIAVNSISASVQKPVKTLLFADDIVLYISCSDVSLGQTILQDATNQVTNWLTENGFQPSD